MVLELEEVQVWPPPPHAPSAAYLSSAFSISGQVTQLTPVSNSQTDDITPLPQPEIKLSPSLSPVFPSSKKENVLRPLRLQCNVVVSQIHSRADLSEISLKCRL